MTVALLILLLLLAVRHQRKLMSQLEDLNVKVDEVAQSVKDAAERTGRVQTGLQNLIDELKANPPAIDLTEVLTKLQAIKTDADAINAGA